MRDFSIELAVGRIQNPKTKTYMDEVYRSYANDNLRSAVVGLWSVAVCDMLFKLDELATVHSDTTAQRILSDIKQKQEANPRSPEWESDLLERIARDTELLEVGETEGLRHLHRQRHLAAHPVLTGRYELHSPTREDVRALLRVTLEGLFTKPAILSRKVFDAFVEDLEKNKDLLPRDSDLQKYIEAKYLGKISAPVETSILRSLWKLVFCIHVGTQPRCDTNRGINFRALQIVFDRNKQAALVEIQDNQAFYSQIAGDPEILDLLSSFLSVRPDVWPLLREDAQVLISNHLKTSVMGQVIGWFSAPEPSIAQHLEGILNSIVACERGEALELDEEAMSAAIQLGKSDDCEGIAYSIGIACYGKSLNFDAADRNFTRLIAPFIKDWHESHFSEFVHALETNTQTWRRGRASMEHPQVVREFELRFAGLAFPLPENADIAKTFVTETE